MDRLDVERHFADLGIGLSTEIDPKRDTLAEKRRPGMANLALWRGDTPVVRVTWRRDWVPGKLLSFRVTRPSAFRFRAGQFARLGIRGSDDRVIWRALSVVSAEYDDYLEFFVVQVPDGEFSAHLANLGVGSTLLLDRRAFGFLTIERFVDGDQLWLFASGTGVAPYLSILADPETWRRFTDIVVVYSVRKESEFAYRDWFTSLMNHPLVGDHAYRLRFVPVVTGEHVPGVYDQRVTRGIADGSLEAHVDLPLDTQRSRIMVCGNPDLVRDMRTVLGERGFSLARSNQPGQIALELYW